MATRPASCADAWTTGAVWLIAVLLALAAPLALAFPAVARAQPDRVVAIGDIHGADRQFQALLQTLDLVDAELRWVGGQVTLVQTGDFTDRGAGVKQVMDLLMRLESEAANAGGRLVVLLGNHEAMNLMANLRDTNAELLAGFATARSERRREEAYETAVAFHQRRVADLGPLAPTPLSREEWMEAHPPGFFEYMDALGPEGIYGRWLRTKPVVAQVDDSILLHGGLSPEAPTDLAEINERAKHEIESYDRLRARLIEYGIILPFFTFNEITAAVQRELNVWGIRLAPEGPPSPTTEITLAAGDREQIDLLLSLEDLATWSLIDEDGPVWFRGYAQWDEDEGTPLARSLVERYGVARIIVGHTVMRSHRITPRFGDRVFLIDTGMLTSVYSGRASALQIDARGVTAVYTDRQILLVDTVEP